MPKIIPDIPKKFEGRFPDNYKNTFPYWGFFREEEIEANKGKLLMLDIDFGNYCSLNCPSCFRRNGVVDDDWGIPLNYDEIIEKVDELEDLQSIKICGKGEPTENIHFLKLIRNMTERDIGVGVFTKGQVLGNDKEARKYNQRYGIKSAQELCNELHKLKVSIMLGFQSFETEVQDELVREKGHTLVRNKALENLVNAGFNESNLTRLCLCNAPITKTNYNDVFDVYVYARERNIYPVVAVLMVSGKRTDKEFLKKNDLSDTQKVDLWTKIYSWNIEQGIQTLEQIKKEGISAMPGSHPCNQVVCGLYFRGEYVVDCPGSITRLGNVRNENIKNIWKKSQNKKLREGTFNCKCPPKDGITIPNNLYSNVLKNLEKKYS